MDALVPSDTFFQGHFDPASPLSIFSKMPRDWVERFKKAMEEVPSLQDYLSNEHELQRKLKDMGFKPNAVDNRYRFQFWFEYENSVREKRMMNMANVYSLVGPPSTFYTLVMGNPLRVYWLLNKPHEYAVQAREMLAAGMEHMRKVLDRDPWEDPAKPDHRLLAVQLKIVQMMDLRLHGAPTQKIQQAHIHASVNSAGEIEDMGAKKDALQYQESIRQLKALKAKAQGRGAEPVSEPVDAEVVSEPAKGAE